MPGSVMSSTYWARPVTLSSPSLRGTDTPTMRWLVINDNYRTPGERLMPPFLSAGLSEKFVSGKHRPPPEIRGLHHSAQSFAHVGRQWIPVVKPLGCDLKGRIRIEYDQVRIVSGSNATLAILAARQSSRTLGHPAGNVQQRESSLTGLGPHHCERDGQT